MKVYDFSTVVFEKWLKTIKVILFGYYLVVLNSTNHHWKQDNLILLVKVSLPLSKLHWRLNFSPSPLRAARRACLQASTGFISAV